MDDLQAIRRLKGGDIGGLETLITRYQEKAIRAAYLVIHNKLTALLLAHKQTWPRSQPWFPIRLANAGEM
jgi:hypothetical protein